MQNGALRLFDSTCRNSYFGDNSAIIAGNGRVLKVILQIQSREMCNLHKEKAGNEKKLYMIIRQKYVQNLPWEEAPPAKTTKWFDEQHKLAKRTSVFKTRTIIRSFHMLFHQKNVHRLFIFWQQKPGFFLAFRSKWEYTVKEQRKEGGVMVKIH